MHQAQSSEVRQTRPARQHASNAGLWPTRCPCLVERAWLCRPQDKKNSNDMANALYAHPFSFFCLHPAEAGGASLAFAAQRAGGVGILDISRCTLAEQSAAIAQMLAGIDSPALSPLGLRLRPDQFPSAPLARVSGPLLCSVTDAAAMEAALADPNLLQQLARLHVEIPSLAALEALRAGVPRPAGLIARSQETAGWAGDTGGLVLMQALLASALAPVWVQGGVGPGGIAACAAAGAQGVVLDDQLLLLAESPLRAEWRNFLENANSESSELLGENLGAAV